MKKKKRIFKGMCNTEQTDVVTKVTEGTFDPIYSESPYVIVVEIPYIGVRYPLSRLRYNKDMKTLLKKVEGNDSEFFELYGQGEANSKILSYRFKSLHTTPGVKFRLFHCVHYHILKNGIIRGKQYSIPNKDKISIKFTTLYKYHLIYPKKFLSVYENRQISNMGQDIWKIMQEDIRIRLDKKIAQFIIDCDYDELNSQYNNLKFEEVLMPEKIAILNEYGIYIDEAFVDNLTLPQDIIDASEELEATSLRKVTQLKAAQIQNEIDASKIASKREEERKQTQADIEAMMGIDSGNLEKYIRLLHARNLRAAAFVNGQLASSETNPMPGYNEYKQSKNTDFVDVPFSNPGDNPVPIHNEYVQAKGADYAISVYENLYGSEVCDEYGELSLEYIELLQEYNQSLSVCTNIEYLRIDEYEAILEHLNKGKAKVKVIEKGKVVV